jgi:DNA-binding beta-propeller fold protein YncE
VAIDPAAGKIYWTNQFSDEVRVGNLDGTGTGAATLFGGEGAPGGLTIDRAANKVYWANFGPGLITNSGFGLDPLCQLGDIQLTLIVGMYHE